MKEQHITYSVRRLLSKRVIISGGKVTDTAPGVPASFVSLGDTMYHIHLVSPGDGSLSEADWREAISQAEENLKTRYMDNRSTLPK